MPEEGEIEDREDGTCHRRGQSGREGRGQRKTVHMWNQVRGGAGKEVGVMIETRRGWWGREKTEMG